MCVIVNHMQGIIRLCYRKIIDHSVTEAWDRAVFDATHMEFYMQAQRLDPTGKYTTFKELYDNIPDAQHLHYLASSAAMGYIKLLNDIIPDIKNQLGELCLPFHDFKLEILQSHLEHKSFHKISISFFSDPLSWINTVGERILISKGDRSESLRSGLEIDTDLIAIVPKLSISHYCSSFS